jgi:hypothetical protein
MGVSTGPIAALGVITWANGVILQPGEVEDTLKFTTRVAVGTGIAALGLSLVEKGSPELARGIAFVALITALFTQIGGRKSPTENLLSWWKGSA